MGKEIAFKESVKSTKVDDSGTSVHFKAKKSAYSSRVRTLATAGR